LQELNKTSTFNTKSCKDLFTEPQIYKTEIKKTEEQKEQDTIDLQAFEHSLFQFKEEEADVVPELSKENKRKSISKEKKYQSGPRAAGN